MPIKVIARVLGCSKNTVKAALASEGPPKYSRQPAGSIVDAVEPRIRELLAACPTMPATVIAERIGWERSIRTLSGRVAELRPVYLPPDPSSRTEYVAGEIAQHDFWFPDIALPVGFGQVRTAAELPVLTMVTGYSRWLSAMLIPTRTAEDLFTGWWGHVQGLGAEAKGLLERCHDYLERSFLPGRTFSCPADFNAQLADWLAVVNQRRRRALGCAPADRIAADRAAMLALPPVAPVTGWRASTRLARDHYVRLDGNDYSVHPAVIGRRIEVVADLARVRAYCDGQLVADHERIWARHQTLSAPEHVAAARALRRERVGLLRPAPAPEVETRCLADYDTALGLDDITSGTDAGDLPGHHDQGPVKQRGARPGRRGGVFDPRAQGPDPARIGTPAGPASPRRELEPRGVLGCLPATRGRCPGVPRRRRTHPRRPLPGA
jgi:transposase